MLEDHTTHGAKMKLERKVDSLSMQLKPQIDAFKQSTQETIRSAKRQVAIVVKAAQLFKHYIETWVWISLTPPGQNIVAFFLCFCTGSR